MLRRLWRVGARETRFERPVLALFQGEQGYVSSEEIKPAASSMLIASVTTKPTDSINVLAGTPQ